MKQLPRIKLIALAIFFVAAFLPQSKSQTYNDYRNKYDHQEWPKFKRALIEFLGTCRDASIRVRSNLMASIDAPVLAMDYGDVLPAEVDYIFGKVEFLSSVWDELKFGLDKGWEYHVKAEEEKRKNLIMTGRYKAVNWISDKIDLYSSVIRQIENDVGRYSIWKTQVGQWCKSQDLDKDCKGKVSELFDALAKQVEVLKDHTPNQDNAETMMIEQLIDGIHGQMTIMIFCMKQEKTVWIDHSKTVCVLRMSGWHAITTRLEALRQHPTGFKYPLNLKIEKEIYVITTDVIKSDRLTNSGEQKLMAQGYPIMVPRTKWLRTNTGNVLDFNKNNEVAPDDSYSNGIPTSLYNWAKANIKLENGRFSFNEDFVSKFTPDPDWTNVPASLREMFQKI